MCYRQIPAVALLFHRLKKESQKDLGSHFSIKLNLELENPPNENFSDHVRKVRPGKPTHVRPKLTQN